MAKRSRSRSSTASRKSVVGPELRRYVSRRVSRTVNAAFKRLAKEKNAAVKRLDLQLKKEKRSLALILRGCPFRVKGGYVPK